MTIWASVSLKHLCMRWSKSNNILSLNNTRSFRGMKLRTSIWSDGFVSFWTASIKILLLELSLRLQQMALAHRLTLSKMLSTKRWLISFRSYVALKLLIRASLSCTISCRRIHNWALNTIWRTSPLISKTWSRTTLNHIVTQFVSWISHLILLVFE